MTLKVWNMKVLIIYVINFCWWCFSNLMKFTESGEMKFFEMTTFIYPFMRREVLWNDNFDISIYEKGSSLKWQLSPTHSWEKKFFEMATFTYPFLRKEVLCNDNFHIPIHEKRSSLKWQLSHTHSCERKFFEMTTFTYPFMYCKCTKLLQYIHINFLEFKKLLKVY